MNNLIGETNMNKELSTAEYFMVVAEIDASYFVLEEMIGKQVRRTPIEQMIDQATGYDQQQTDEIKKLVARIKELQAKLPPDDWHFIAPTN
jgi:hypothetical protein